MKGHTAATWRGRRVRWSTLFAATLSLAGTTVVGALSAGASTTNYVALGDSYASGPFIPSQQSGAPGCLRSDHNYAHLVAEALNLSLTDVSCSGATTDDLRTPETTSSGLVPAQLNAVSADTSLVTLSIGGDNLGFVDIIKQCAAATPWGPTPSGMTCKAHYDAGGVDQLGAAITALAPKIAGDLETIHARAPGASVFVVGYPDIVPPTGDGCWPHLPFTRTDAPYLRSTEVNLNTMLSSVASANGAAYVDTYTPSENFNACTARSVRWVEPIVPTSLAAPIHPDGTGEAGMARVIESSLATHGV